ncbi:hypothetical protein [Streptomyces sp. H27-S2]|uniref:hypothetical protein n=1 Tax=Streptomyces antarcticus TaxID=2996458 RepID=UPI002271BD59|nr:hypothetical protein [Streptomyces sp. H27-S2]MCY0954402.1 hypothetical protein [Streptomyces sp. H27-S2]
MSGNAPVDPAEIPVFTGDLATLDEKVKLISSGGATVSTKASDVHTSFGGLQAFYQAPEADQLFATTKPVQDLGLKLSSDMCTIASALGTYSRDAAPIVKKLENLKAEAQAFRTKTDKDEKWREDGDLIDENLERRNKIAEVWEQFHEVERAAHAKIVALVNGKPLRVNDGSNAPDMYGYDAQALKQAKSLPWGDAVEESIPGWQIWEHAWEFGKGFVVDGVWATLKGLGGLVGLQGWDVFKQSWTGLAKLGTGLGIAMIPGVGPLFMAAPDDKLPSWLRDSRTAMKETGKALLAWDQWGSNPGRAAGAVTFNVVTTVFTGGAGGAASGAGKAGAVAKTLSFAGKAGRAIDPMTYIFKGAGAGFSKIGDVMAGLKGMGRFEAPSINLDGAIALPDGAIMLPDGAIHLPSGSAVPDGAIKLTDGTIKLPAGTTTFPPGTVKLPDGTSRFMDIEGNIYKADGSLAQTGKAAKHEPSPDTGADADVPRADAPKVDSPATAKVPELELAGVGARSADNSIHLGSNISDPVHTLDNGAHGADHTPTGRAGDHTTPGGHAPDNMPRGDLNNPGGAPRPDTPGGGGARPDVPGTGGTHPDGPGATTGRTDGPSGSGHGDGPSAGGHDPSAGPHPAAPGSDALDNAARADRAAADAARVDEAMQRAVRHPEFMLDGPNPYGPRGRLELEQIEEIQVYRANQEPGYFDQYYQNQGHRRRLSVKDESGFTPPQLTRISKDQPWIQAKDAPQAPEPWYLDPDYIPVGRNTVSDSARLNVLDAAAKKRHFAVTWDNVVEKWKSLTGDAHSRHGTHETAAEWGEARGAYKESHSNMIDKTEKFGETAAEHHYIAENHKGFDKETLLGPKNGNDQFDQVWTHEDGRVVVIEAKSSVDADLGKRDLPPPKRRSVSQGSREYFFDILKVMQKRGETDLVEAIERAIEANKLDYVVVKGEKNAGRYTGLQYRRFDISKGTLP